MPVCYARLIGEALAVAAESRTTRSIDLRPSRPIPRRFPLLGDGLAESVNVLVGAPLWHCGAPGIDQKGPCAQSAFDATAALRCRALMPRLPAVKRRAKPRHF